jgi:hypothetical protein
MQFIRADEDVLTGAIITQASCGQMDELGDRII